MDRQALARIHAEHPEWGSYGAKWARGVIALIDLYAAESVLDFGAGKGALGAAVKPQKPEIDWRDYDPAYADEGPCAADLVVCTHVLEHVEDISETIGLLRDLTRKALFVNIGTGKGREWAPNRNTFPVTWWSEALSRWFRVHPIYRGGMKRGRVRWGHSDYKYLAAVCEPREK